MKSFDFFMYWSSVSIGFCIVLTVLANSMVSIFLHVERFFLGIFIRKSEVVLVICSLLFAGMEVDVSDGVMFSEEIYIPNAGCVYKFHNGRPLWIIVLFYFEDSGGRCLSAVSVYSVPAATGKSTAAKVFDAILSAVYQLMAPVYELLGTRKERALDLC